MDKKVVIILAHHDLQKSTANKALIEAVKDPVNVSVYDLYEQKDMTQEEWASILMHASALVLQFPFCWMSAPAMMKKWFDEVFYNLSDSPTVAGKPFMIATTTGASNHVYRSGGKVGFTVDELLRPYQAAAAFAGMTWKTPLVAYGMDTQDAARNLAVSTEEYKRRIDSLKVKKEAEW